MWNKPYTLKEGTAIVAGLLVTGGLLQVTLGPLEVGTLRLASQFYHSHLIRFSSYRSIFVT